MRLIAITLALPLLVGSAAAAEPAEPVDAMDIPILGDVLRSDVSCRDRIITLREERGLPRLERDTAAPDEAEAQMIYAVHRTIDGCHVLVMANDPRDVRPLPRFAAGHWRVRPVPHRAQ